MNTFSQIQKWTVLFFVLFIIIFIISTIVIIINNTMNVSIYKLKIYLIYFKHDFNEQKYVYYNYIIRCLL